jgi:hypothetical protein
MVPFVSLPEELGVAGCRPPLRLHQTGGLDVTASENGVMLPNPRAALLGSRGKALTS